ncbi:PP2C family protein-serine/threonine phosphatase [Nocardioides acrostichi]|uniref:Serine/threonine-protein phosphatase n=1 Tax=Nocardioides acrostichi TaxID=2784339 RepID=A0A930V1V7_9ACTN|nr:PP2C family protein-serine/threonine phosphatase [Nocardioides acrostichi]MBF4163135.1 serine/threonine-protein phosphatase [Nocardioides acrostichi]
MNRGAPRRPFGGRSWSRGAIELATEWSRGTPRSQGVVLALLVLLVTGCFTVTWHRYQVLPVGTYFVWLVIGLALLRFRPLLVLTIVVLGGVAVLSFKADDGGAAFSVARLSGLLALSLGGALILVQSGLQRSGLPAPLGDSMLADLRDRLQRQGVVPPLPVPWRCQTSMVAAHGVGYAGDFMVADLREGPDGDELELILVDVVGKGIAAGTGALQFAGALSGLIGALPPRRLFEAANDFLLRQESEETLATAVHVLIDLATGRFVVHSAGHPPALRWNAARREWIPQTARGMALGVSSELSLHDSSGTLARGEALMFYTDGVVERPDADIDDGIAWLQRMGSIAVAHGFEGAAERILRRVPRGDDDRAVLIIDRGLERPVGGPR